MLFRRVCISTLLCLLAWVAVAHPAEAQHEPSVSVVPSEISIEPATPTTVVLVFQNPTDREAVLDEVSWILPPGVSVNPAEELEGLELLPQGSATVTLTLQVDEKASNFLAGTAVLRARLGTSAIAAALAVERQRTVPPPDLLEVALLGPAAEVSELRPGDVFLTVRNPGSQPVHITCITWQAPDGITAMPTDDAALATRPPQCDAAEPTDPRPKVAVGAGDTIVFQFELTASKLLPGKAQALLMVDAVSSDGTREQSLFVHAVVDTAVFGIGALTGLVGVPTFFFLPGYLAVVTIHWIRGDRDSGKSRFWSDLKSPVAFLAGFIGSIAVFGVTTLIADRLASDWSYLDGFGIAEAAIVLGPVIIVIGLATFVANELQKQAEKSATEAAEQAAKEAAEARERETPPSGAGPLELLEYLASSEHEARLQAWATANREQLLAFEGRSEEGTSWFSPPIEIDTGGLYGDEVHALDEALDALTTATELIDELKPLLANHRVELRFQTVTSFPAPRAVEPEAERLTATNTVALVARSALERD